MGRVNTKLLIMAKFSDIKIFRVPNYKVNVEWTSLDYNINRYKERYNLETDPDFQRGYVWTLEQKIAYIEFIIRGGDSGKSIYFNQTGWMGKIRGNMVLVDGKQRLTTVLDFINNKIPIFDGHYYKDFTDSLPSHCEFHFHVNDLPTKKDIIEWYLSMNTGGSIHTTEDLAPALNILNSL